MGRLRDQLSGRTALPEVKKNEIRAILYSGIWVERMRNEGEGRRVRGGTEY